MAYEEFSRSVVVSADRGAVWRYITDVPTLVGSLSLLGDVDVIEEMAAYRAVLQDRVGRFALKADLDITVTEHAEPELVVIRAEGEDRQVASRIVVALEVRLSEREQTSTEITVAGSYEVSGRVATLGAGVIRKKAAKVLEEFFGSLEAGFR